MGDNTVSFDFDIEKKCTGKDIAEIMREAMYVMAADLKAAYGSTTNADVNDVIEKATVLSCEIDRYNNSYSVAHPLKSYNNHDMGWYMGVFLRDLASVSGNKSDKIQLYVQERATYNSMAAAAKKWLEQYDSFVERSGSQDKIKTTESDLADCKAWLAKCESLKNSAIESVRSSYMIMKAKEDEFEKELLEARLALSLLPLDLANSLIAMTQTWPRGCIQCNAPDAWMDAIDHLRDAENTINAAQSQPDDEGIHDGRPTHYKGSRQGPKGSKKAQDQTYKDAV